MFLKSTKSHHFPLSGKVGQLVVLLYLQYSILLVYGLNTMSCSTNDDIRNSRYSEVCSIFVHYVFQAELASVYSRYSK